MNLFREDFQQNFLYNGYNEKNEDIPSIFIHETHVYKYIYIYMYERVPCL